MGRPMTLLRRVSAPRHRLSGRWRLAVLGLAGLTGTAAVTVNAVPTLADPPNVAGLSVDTGSTTGTTTPSAFASGAGFRIVALGTYTTGAGAVADANCVAGAPSPSQQLGATANGQSVSLQWLPLHVSGQACDPTNGYYADYNGQGARLTFSMGAPGGNVGSLTLYSWAANGGCSAPLPAPEPWYGSDLYAQSAFANPYPQTFTITYGSGETRTVSTGEQLVAGCAAHNHNFSMVWACNSIYPTGTPGDPNGANLFSGELDQGSWIVDSFTNITRTGANAYPQYWWQGTGHGGLRSCNDEVVQGADGSLVTYTITAKGDYQWEAALRPGELGDAMCSTPSATAVAVDPRTGIVYVADQGLDTVSALTKDGSTLVQDPFHAAPDGYPSQQGLAVNPRTELLYVGAQGAPVVRVISLSSHQLLATISLGTPQFARVQNIDAIAVNTTTNRVYVANDLLNTVFVIDGTPGSPTFDKVIAQLPLPGDPEGHLGVAVDPTTNRVHVSDYGTASLYTVDGSKSSILSTTVLGTPPVEVAVNPSTHRVYTTDPAVAAVSVIDGGSGQLLTQINGVGTRPLGIGVLPGNNRVYVASLGEIGSPGQVTVIDGRTDTVAGTVASPFGGPDPEAVSVDAGHGRVYVANSTSHTVSVFSGTSSPSSPPQRITAVAASISGGQAHPVSHWLAERAPFYGQDTPRNIGYYQSLWVDKSGAMTEADGSPHWVPAHPDASGECADPRIDPDHTYTLTWKAPFNGPMHFRIYGYYYYEGASFGEMSISLKRNPQ